MIFFKGSLKKKLYFSAPASGHILPDKGLFLVTLTCKSNAFIEDVNIGKKSIIRRAIVFKIR
jgi:hypothetical protein